MGRLHPFSYFVTMVLGMVCLGATAYSIAEDDIDQEIEYWLQTSEKHARNIIDPNEKELALYLLATAHASAAHYEKAYSIVSELDKSRLKIYWPLIIMKQARTGDIKGALVKAQTFKDREIQSRCMYYVIYECVKNNIPYALELIEKQPKPDRCSLYEMVVREQVLQGKLEKARKTFRKISDPNSKSEANNWIMAGQIVEQDDLAVARAQEKNFTDDPNSYLRQIAESKIEVGEIEKAEKIIDSVSRPYAKVIGYLDLAEYFESKDQKALFEKYLHKAQRENEFVESVFMASCFYWDMAKLYVETGNWETGLECAKKAENIFSESFQKEYKSGKFPRLIYNDNYQLYRLMIYAGRQDEVFQVIINKSETFPLDIIEMLTQSYAKKGNMEKVRTLFQAAKTEKEKSYICGSIAYGLIDRKKEREENDK